MAHIDAELLIRTDKDDVVHGQKLYLSNNELVYPLRTHHNSRHELVGLTCLQLELDGYRSIRFYPIKRFEGKTVVIFIERKA